MLLKHEFHSLCVIHVVFRWNVICKPNISKPIKLERKPLGTVLHYGTESFPSCCSCGKNIERLKRIIYGVQVQYRLKLSARPVLQLFMQQSFWTFLSASGEVLISAWICEAAFISPLPYRTEHGAKLSVIPVSSLSFNVDHGLQISSKSVRENFDSCDNKTDILTKVAISLITDGIDIDGHKHHIV
jgi:hypothetical protein